MSNTKEIVYIDVDKLLPHPNNPRKDVGDTTELAESIKAKGILQNLTVVPFKGIGEERYTVVIGHRRLAAAKQAGVKQVPCIVSNMNENEQISTMLLENMQRSDLTVYEQAEGFQLMFDFGETVKSVSEKTGFSESTIRRRVKLLELDREKFKESVDRGATLDDYLKLDQLKDIDLKNEVLEAVGTNNFNWRLNEALKKELRQENKIKIIETLETFAVLLGNSDDDELDFCERFWPNDDGVEVPKDAGERKYYYAVFDGFIDLFCEPTNNDNAVNDVDMEEKQHQRELSERRSKLDSIQLSAYELRQEFINKCTGLAKKKDLIFEISTYAELYGSSLWDYKSVLARLIDDIDEFEGSDVSGKILSLCKEKPIQVALIIAWFKLDNKYKTAHTYDCKYNNNNDLLILYDYLMKLGYEMSDEEARYVYGSHELFVKPERY